MARLRIEAARSQMVDDDPEFAMYGADGEGVTLSHFVCGAAPNAVDGQLEQERVEEDWGQVSESAANVRLINRVQRWSHGAGRSITAGVGRRLGAGTHRLASDLLWPALEGSLAPKMIDRSAGDQHRQDA